MISSSVRYLAVLLHRGVTRGSERRVVLIEANHLNRVVLLKDAKAGRVIAVK